MTTLFYIAAAVAVVSTVMVVTRSNTVHALLYLVLSLFAVSLVFWSVGAPFAAALEVIVYAGAIIVLFVFVVMLLNPGTGPEASDWTHVRHWVLPTALAGVLFAELMRVTVQTRLGVTSGYGVSAAKVGAAMYGPYLLGVEVASMLLLGGLVAAYRIGRREVKR